MFVTGTACFSFWPISPSTIPGEEGEGVRRREVYRVGRDGQNKIRQDRTGQGWDVMQLTVMQIVKEEMKKKNDPTPHHTPYDITVDYTTLHHMH